MKKIFLILLPVLSIGKDTCPTNQLIIQAEVLSYSQSQNLYTAQNKVHITQPLLGCKKRELFANQVTYDKTNKRVAAIGKVILKDADGNISYADQAEISDNMKEGIMHSFHLVTHDKERILANSVDRKKGAYSAFQGASYTPCNVCDKEEAFWQLNASEVEHDQETHTIYYYHATLRLGGVPIFYTPYFSHPDPTIKRKSGFLRPSIGVTTDTGVYFTESYFHVIDEYSDMTITPILMKKENPIVLGNYRKNFTDGNFELSTSVHSQKKPLHTTAPVTPVNQPSSIKKERWHVLSQFNYDLDEKQKIRLKINRASDTTYLIRYPMITRETSTVLQNNQNLTSNMIYERFNNNAYSTIKGFWYQTSLPKTTPIVLPDASHHFFSKAFGGNYNISTNLLGLKRNWGVPGEFAKDTGRFSLDSYWSKPMLLDSGHLFTLGLKARGDIYYTKGFDAHTYSTSSASNLYALQKDNQKTTGRFFPQANLDWQYPLISKERNYIIEPKAMLAIATASSGSKFIPNNDSRTFTLDDTTLFLANRFDGLDRTDSGRRAVYGIEQKYYFRENKSISWFVGHSTRLDGRQVLTDPNLGENRKYSDIVNRFKLQPHEYMSVRYRNAMDTKTKRQRFMEIGTLLGKPIASFDIGYVRNSINTLNKTTLSQMHWKVSSKINNAWTLSYAEIRDFLRKNKEPLKQFANIAWENECLKFELGIFKSAIKVQDVTTNQGFLFQVSFKNLGGYKPLTAEQFSGSILSHF